MSFYITHVISISRQFSSTEGSFELERFRKHPEIDGQTPMTPGWLFSGRLDVFRFGTPRSEGCHLDGTSGETSWLAIPQGLSFCIGVIKHRKQAPQDVFADRAGSFVASYFEGPGFICLFFCRSATGNQANTLNMEVHGETAGNHTGFVLIQVTSSFDEQQKGDGCESCNASCISYDSTIYK